MICSAELCINLMKKCAGRHIVIGKHRYIILTKRKEENAKFNEFC